MNDRTGKAKAGTWISLSARWAALTLASILAAGVMFIVIGTLFGGTLDQYGGYAFGAIFALLFGTALGAGQRLAMRRVLDPGAAWILATLAGFLFGTLFIFGVLDAGSRDSSLAEGVLHALLLGGGLGIAQWLTLRQRVPNPGWWILVTLGAWIAAELVGRAMTVWAGPPLDLLVLIVTGASLQGLGFALLITSRWSARTDDAQQPHRPGPAVDDSA